MEDKLLEHSYRLGRFTGMVQAMEDALPEAVNKGEHWGEHILPLFMANIHSSLQIAGKIISHFPADLSVAEGMVTAETIKEFLSHIDIELLDKNIDETQYKAGYLNWCPLSSSPNLEEKNSTTLEYKTDLISEHHNPSFNLGVFMANLQCIEEHHISTTGKHSDMGMANMLLLLQTNFESTMQLVDTLLAKLPEMSIFKENEASIAQLQKARTLLDIEVLSSMPLDLEQFEKGFDTQVTQYLSN